MATRENLFPRESELIVTNLSYPTKGIVSFYNGRGTAEQWTSSKANTALNWTRLSCHKFVANQSETLAIHPTLIIWVTVLEEARIA